MSRFSLRQLLRQAEDLHNAAAGAGPLSGVLSVGCYVTFAPTVLPPLLQDFSADHHKWLLEPAGSDTYVIRSLQNGMCLDSGVSHSGRCQPLHVELRAHRCQPPVAIRGGRPGHLRHSVAADR